jgi:hypothetical protein
MARPCRGLDRPCRLLEDEREVPSRLEQMERSPQDRRSRLIAWVHEWNTTRQG